MFFVILPPAQIKKINNINKVGVFVNAPIEDVLHMVDECRLHMVQLHGDESPKYCEKIADYVSVVKAFRISDNDSIEWMINPFMDVCDMFMFDTMGAGYGGTGKKFDWNILTVAISASPSFLAAAYSLRTFCAQRIFAQTRWEVTVRHRHQQ